VFFGIGSLCLALGLGTCSWKELPQRGSSGADGTIKAIVIFPKESGLFDQ